MRNSNARTPELRTPNPNSGTWNAEHGTGNYIILGSVIVARVPSGDV
jgi:hypothetical protein